MNCLDDATLEQLLRGALAGDALARVDAHLDGCASCRARLGERARRLASSGGGAAPAAHPLEALAPAPDPYLGRVIAERYRIIRRLGGGGMGTVYEAEHVLIGRRVAVKILLPQWASQTDVVRRFQNEARAAGTLRHPGILQALDLGRTEEGMPYLVLDLLEGHDLEAKVAREAPLPIGEAVTIVRTIADAIGAAHAIGIIHRDLKPENVFLTTRGEIKVLDFGISKITSGLAPGAMTGSGAVMGTPLYMPPEQFEDAARADPRSDVYSLGVILYRALTAQLPFVSDTFPGLLMAIVGGRVTPPRALRPELPPALEAAMIKALRARPDERFQTMEELSLALAPYAGGEAARGAGAERVGAVRLERRVATLLFAAGVRDRDAATRIVTEHGGRVLDGERFFAIFGETTWHGDESVRAVDAAVRLRPGADAVSVVTGHVQRELDPSASDLAERAVGAARPGLAGVAVLAPTTRVAARFELRTLAPDLAEVLAPSSAGASVLPPAHEILPLVGRQTERARLAETFERALEESRPLAIVATGEPGIGKSRLVTEAIAMARATSPRFEVLVGRGVPRGGAQFGALAEALALRARETARARGSARIDPPAGLDERREAVRHLAAEAAEPGREGELAEFLGELLDVPMPASSALSAARSNARLMRDQRGLALSAYLRGLAARAPLLIVLEDLQWVDPDSLALVARVMGRELWDRPVVVLGTARSEVWTPSAPFDDAEAPRLELAGLGLAGVRALAESVLGIAIDEDLARRLLTRTGGNPLFIEQTARVLADDSRGLIAASEGVLPLPLDVEAAVQARLLTLEPTELDVATRGAVLGGAFSQADLARLGAAEPAGALTRLARRGLVRRRPGASAAEDQWELRSSVIAEVLVENLDPIALRDVHLRAASVWQERGDREWAAWHFERAGERGAAAAEYVSCALAAGRVGDGSRVLRCADAAMEIGVEEDAELALHLARAEALEHAGLLDEQEGALSMASELASTPEERAAIGTASAVRTLRQHGPKESLPAFTRAVADARRAGAPAVLARALGAHAVALSMAGRLDEAAAAIGEAELLVLTRAHALRAELASWRAQHAAALGDLGARRAAYLAALALFEEVGDERARAGVLVNLGDVLNRFGAYAEAAATLSDALARCRLLGMRVMEGYALANLGYARTMGGELAAAAADLENARLLAESIGDRHLATWVGLYRARLALASGESQRAREEAGALAARAASLGIGAAEVLARGVEARAALALGDLEGAHACIAHALERRDALGGLEEDEGELFAVHVHVLSALGRADEGAHATTRYRSWLDATARRIADPEWRARFLRDVGGLHR